MEQKIRIGNKTLLALLIAEQLIYVSSSRLLDRAVAVLGLVEETCTCILDWKPFILVSPEPDCPSSACDPSSSCSLKYSCAKCEEHKFPSYLYV